MLEDPNILHQLRMREALKEAKRAFDEDEVPVGAIIVHENKIVGRAYNQVEKLKDPTAHAEMVAITQAANTLGCKWLHDCVLYVTLEPCSMCAGALVLSRIKTIYYGAKDPKTGGCGSIFDIADSPKLNHQIDVFGGLLEEESAELLQKFFKSKRKTSRIDEFSE